MTIKSLIQKGRYEICQTCPNNKLSFAKICKECGCFMPIKTRFMWASCPLGFWTKMDSESIVELENSLIDMKEVE